MNAVGELVTLAFGSVTYTPRVPDIYTVLYWLTSIRIISSCHFSWLTPFNECLIIYVIKSKFFGRTQKTLISGPVCIPCLISWHPPTVPCLTADSGSHKELAFPASQVGRAPQPCTCFSLLEGLSPPVWQTPSYPLHPSQAPPLVKVFSDQTSSLPLRKTCCSWILSYFLHSIIKSVV